MRLSKQDPRKLSCFTLYRLIYQINYLISFYIWDILCIISDFWSSLFISILVCLIPPHSVRHFSLIKRSIVLLLSLFPLIWEYKIEFLTIDKKTILNKACVNIKFFKYFSLPPMKHTNKVTSFENFHLIFEEPWCGSYNCKIHYIMFHIFIVETLETQHNICLKSTVASPMNLIIEIIC